MIVGHEQTDAEGGRRRVQVVSDRPTSVVVGATPHAAAVIIIIRRDRL